MSYDNQRVKYSFGVVIANMELEPYDENAEVALDSLSIIMDELGIDFHDYSVIDGFANSKDIPIKDAREQVEDIKRLVIPKE